MRQSLFLGLCFCFSAWGNQPIPVRPLAFEPSQEADGKASNIGQQETNGQETIASELRALPLHSVATIAVLHTSHATPLRQGS